MNISEDQVEQHISHLQSQGFSINKLELSGRWVRCKQTGQTAGRGELAYACTVSTLENGNVGIVTSYRGTSGRGSYKTSGPGCISNFASNYSSPYQGPTDLDYSDAAKKAFGVWTNSSVIGRSDYLARKGVQGHGIRYCGDGSIFVPVRDESGFLWGWQKITAKGDKKFSRGCKTKGCFHTIGNYSSDVIGICEGYVTGATIHELLGVPVMIAFYASNLTEVVNKNLFSRHILIFADNDAHLDKNIGMIKAGEAKALAPDLIRVVEPSFDDITVVSKDRSDWNDLVRLKGREFARSQIRQKISGIGGFSIS